MCLFPMFAWGADSAIGNLGEIGNTAIDDQIAIVDVSENPDATKRVSVNNIVAPAYFADSTEADQGAAGSGRSVKDLVDLIGSNNATIVLTHHGSANTDYIVGTDFTIPANITLDFQNGARISVSTAKTLTLQTTSIIAEGSEEIFIGAGSYTFADGSGLESSWFATFEIAVTKIGSDKVKLIVSGAASIADDCTINANTTLNVPSTGRILTVANTKTLTINGPFDAGLYQVFSGDGTVSFGYGSITEDYPEWWGAKGDNNVANATVNTSAFNSAISSLTDGGRVKISAGNYRVNGTINLTTDFVDFVGVGIASVISSTATGVVLNVGVGGGTYQRHYVGHVRIYGDLINTTTAIKFDQVFQLASGISNVIVGNVTTYGIYANAPDGIFIKDSYVLMKEATVNPNYCIYLVNANGTSVKDNYIDGSNAADTVNNFNIGIYADGVNGVAIRDNVIQWCRKMIKIASCNSLVIEGNYTESFKVSAAGDVPVIIDLKGSAGNLVKGVSIIGNDLVGTGGVPGGGNATTAVVVDMDYTDNITIDGNAMHVNGSTHAYAARGTANTGKSIYLKPTNWQSGGFTWQFLAVNPIIYDSVWVTADQLRVETGNQVLGDYDDGAAGKFRAWECPNTASSELRALIPFPKEWKSADKIWTKLYYATATATANTLSIASIAKSFAIDETISPAFNAGTAAAFVDSATAYFLKNAIMSTSLVVDPADDMLIIDFKNTRPYSYTGNMYLLGIEVNAMLGNAQPF